MILATTGPVWSLSLTGSATYPLASSPATTGSRRSTGGAARPKRVGLLLAMILVLPPAAHATSGQGIVVIQRWKAMDSCAVQAQRAFPNFTAEANAKRDAKLKECLAGQNLPPRDAPRDAAAPPR